MRSFVAGAFVLVPLFVTLVLVGRFAFGDSWRESLLVTAGSFGLTALFVLWVFGIFYLAGV